MTSSVDDGYKDMVLDLICLDPYFLGIWVFRQIIEFNYYENKDIKNAVTLLDPAFAANWDDYILKMIDRKVKIPFSDDKEKLLADLIDARTTLEFEHQWYDLPENVVTPSFGRSGKKLRSWSGIGNGKQIDYSASRKRKRLAKTASTK